MIHIDNGGRRALVTLATGEKYRSMWLRCCQHSWRAYAARHGLDVIVFDAPIAPPGSLKARSPHWEKLLVCSAAPARDYEALCWLDADIIINHAEAPNVFDGWDAEKIAVLAFEDIPEFEVKNLRLSETRRKRVGAVAPELYIDGPGWYRASGYQTFPDRHLNTGVMLFTPERHRAFLEGVFFAHEKDRAGWDQTVASYEILTQNLWAPLPWRFNSLVELEIIWSYPWEQFGEIVMRPGVGAAIAQTMVRNSWFAHFNGAPYKHLMDVVANF